MAPQQPSFPIEAQAQVQFGRDICGNLPAAESREWLVTNGIGGFASGTIATGMTRRYHGLLIAALQPPVGRSRRREKPRRRIVALQHTLGQLKKYKSTRCGAR